MSLILSLPDVVSGNLVANWLQLTDLSKLDSAFSNHKQRRQFCDLAYAYNPATTSINTPKLPDLGIDQYSQFVAWLLLRRLHLRTFSVYMHSHVHLPDNLFSSYVTALGSSLRSIDIWGYHSFPELRESLMSDIANYCPRLTHLGMEVYFFYQSDAYTSVFAHCTHIKSLRITCGTAQNSAFATIAEYCTQLRSLQINSTGITTVDLQQILERNAATLESLQLARCYNLKDTDYFNISKCTQLKRLHTEANSRMTPDTVRAIVHSCSALVELDFGYCTINDALVEEITICCPLLQLLNLDYCHQITKIALMAIADNCTSLTHLSIVTNVCATHENVMAVWGKRGDLLIRIVPCEPFISCADYKLSLCRMETCSQPPDGQRALQKMRCVV